MTQLPRLSKHVECLKSDLPIQPPCSVQNKRLQISNNLNTIFNSSSQPFSHCRYLNQLKEDDSLCRQAQASGTFYLFHNLSPFLQKVGNKYLVPQLSAAGKKEVSASRKKHPVDHTAKMKQTHTYAISPICSEVIRFKSLGLCLLKREGWQENKEGLTDKVFFWCNVGKVFFEKKVLAGAGQNQWTAAPQALQHLDL